MNLLESFRIALRGLSANKMRSALTMLGIIIGVAAVTSLMSIGRGAQATVTSAITSIGTNLLFVTPGRSIRAGMRQALGSVSTLTLEDARALANSSNAPSVVAVAPGTTNFAQVTASGENTNTRIVGTTPEAQQMQNLELARGEFISERHVQANSRVAVLGSEVANLLFPDRDPVGQTIKINQQQFRVTGVLKSRGGGLINLDDQVLVPVTTAVARLSRLRTAAGGRSINQIVVQVASAEEIEAAKEQIAAILRQRHRITDEDDFTITSQEDVLDILGQVTGVLTLFLGAIAGISLVVGGIGIMNIMLVSVTERTREIGIRKAVGAKRRDILSQFLIESVVLSGFGGAIGLGVGWLGSFGVSQIDLGGQNIPALVTTDIALLAVGVAAAVGLFFGIYPASRAAALHPIDALRYE